MRSNLKARRAELAAIFSHPRTRIKQRQTEPEKKAGDEEGGNGDMTLALRLDELTVASVLAAATGDAV